MRIRKQSVFLFIFLYCVTPTSLPFVDKIVRLSTNDEQGKFLEHDVYLMYDTHEYSEELRAEYQPLFASWLKKFINAAKSYGQCDIFVEFLTYPYSWYSKQKKFKTLEEALNNIGQYNYFTHAFKVFNNNQHLVEDQNLSINEADAFMRFIAFMVGGRVKCTDILSKLDLFIERWFTSFFYRFSNDYKGYSWGDFFRALKDLEILIKEENTCFIGKDKEELERFIAKKESIKKYLESVLTPKQLEEIPVEKLYLYDHYNQKYGSKMCALVKGVFNIDETYVTHNGLYGVTTFTGFDQDLVDRMVDYTTLGKLFNDRGLGTKTHFVLIGALHAEHMRKVFVAKGYDELVVYDGATGPTDFTELLYEGPIFDELSDESEETDYDSESDDDSYDSEEAGYDSESDSESSEEQILSQIQ